MRNLTRNMKCISAPPTYILWDCPRRVKLRANAAQVWGRIGNQPRSSWRMWNKIMVMLKWVICPKNSVLHGFVDSSFSGDSLSWSASTIIFSSEDAGTTSPSLTGVESLPLGYSVPSVDGMAFVAGITNSRSGTFFLPVPISTLLIATTAIIVKTPQTISNPLFGLSQQPSFEGANLLGQFPPKEGVFDGSFDLPDRVGSFPTFFLR